MVEKRRLSSPECYVSEIHFRTTMRKCNETIVVLYTNDVVVLLNEVIVKLATRDTVG